ncbi:hypothetical protein F5Y17DRAFT_457739 [Xylariaceae sp. FL0594]|nr:hypothetical protein F5Y17DRAFT_457739 [Xylariaceae sp. FL0594]
MKFSILSPLLLLVWQSATGLAAPAVEPAGSATLAVREPNIPTEDQVPDLIADPSKFSSYAIIGQPQINEAVFFTGQGGPTINKIVLWANAQGLTTVRNIWRNPSLVRKGQYPNLSADVFRNYQKAFSAYYADQTKGTAYLIFPQSQTPASTGVFYSVELDIIIAEAKVDKIIWLDQDKALGSDPYDWQSEQKVYWKKGDPKPSA